MSFRLDSYWGSRSQFLQRRNYDCLVNIMVNLEKFLPLFWQNWSSRICPLDTS